MTEPTGQEYRQAQTARSRRILIVDDNTDLASLLSSLLAYYGYGVETADCGRDALLAARHFQPSTIVLDINLPDMDGFDVAEAIRKVPELKGVTLIAVSAYNPQTRPRDYHEVGIDHYLVKPVSLDSLIPLLT